MISSRVGYLLVEKLSPLFPFIFCVLFFVCCTLHKIPNVYIFLLNCQFFGGFSQGSACSALLSVYSVFVVCLFVLLFCVCFSFCVSLFGFRYCIHLFACGVLILLVIRKVFFFFFGFLFFANLLHFVDNLVTWMQIYTAQPTYFPHTPPRPVKLLAQFLACFHFYFCSLWCGVAETPRSVVDFE